MKPFKKEEGKGKGERGGKEQHSLLYVNVMVIFFVCEEEGFFP